MRRAALHQQTTFAANVFGLQELGKTNNAQKRRGGAAAGRHTTLQYIHVAHNQKTVPSTPSHLPTRGPPQWMNDASIHDTGTLQNGNLVHFCFSLNLVDMRLR
jgi:hypothetical protein